MGRRVKKGLDYFPLDVDFFQDIKIRKLIRCQGGKALTVYIALLCNIYKEEGYYIRWDNDLPFIISEQTGYEDGYVHEVLRNCVALGLFDKALFESEKIYTSRSIQERYRESCGSSKRRSGIEEYCLLPENGDGNEASDPKKKGKTEPEKAGRGFISSEEIAINSEEMRINSEEMPISSEEMRINSEETPISSEEMRINSEEMPISSEEMRINSEEMPISSEEMRINSEEMPISSEEKEKFPPHPPIKKKKGALSKGESSDEDSPKSAPPVPPYGEVVDMWNSVCRTLPRVVKLTDVRRMKIRQRLSEWGGTPTEQLATLRALLERVEASPFLHGASGRGGWTASFDWFFANESNWVKVSEGNYDTRPELLTNANTEPNGTYQSRMDRERAENAERKRQLAEMAANACAKADALNAARFGNP